MTIVLPHGVVYKTDEWDRLTPSRKLEILGPLKDHIGQTSSLSDLKQMQWHVENFFQSEIEKIRSSKNPLEKEALGFSLPPSRVKHLNRVFDPNLVNRSHSWILRTTIEGIFFLFKPLDTVLTTAINGSAVALQCIEAFLPYRQLVLRNECQARMQKIDDDIANLENSSRENQARIKTKISCYEEMLSERKSTEKKTEEKHQNLQGEITGLQEKLANQVQATQIAKNEKATVENHLEISSSKFQDTMERIIKEHNASVEGLVKRFEERLEKTQVESAKVVQEQNAKFDQERSDRERIFAERELRFNQKEAERDKQLRRYEQRLRDQETEQAAKRSKTESAFFDKISELLNSMHVNSSKEEIGHQAHKWSSLPNLAGPSSLISSQNDPQSPKSGISFEDIYKEEVYRDQLIELGARSEEESKLSS